MAEQEKKKKNYTPLVLRWIQWFFPKLERFAPRLAEKYFIYLFYTPFRYQIPAHETGFLQTSHTFTVHISGNKKIQCYRWGETGPLVVCIHGWAGRAGQFRVFIPELLKAGYRVISFDGPAHGASEGRQTNLLEFEEVLQILSRQEKEAFSVIAHSFGGVAALFAIMNGLKVHRLINISSPSLGSQVIDNYRRIVGATQRCGDAIERHVKEKYGRTFEEFSSLHFVKNLKYPLDFLIVQDDNDPEVSLANATALKEAYPSAEVYLTTGLGHTRILKDPEVILRSIDFLKK